MVEVRVHVLKLRQIYCLRLIWVWHNEKSPQTMTCIQPNKLLRKRIAIVMKMPTE